MEIFTLVKANIRKKKGSFINIIILTAIAVAVTVTILGVKSNYHKGMDQAIEVADSADIIAFMKPSELTDELKRKVEESDLVERVVYYDAICSNGRRVGEYEDGNSGYFMEMREGIQVYNENLDGFLEEAPELQSGEIYLPLGLRSKLSCDVGDTIRYDFIKGIKRDFKIKGFVQEPANGAMLIGWKQEFISKADYDAILKECHAVGTEDMVVDVKITMIYQNPDSDLSVAKFQRELNLETKVIARSLGAVTIEQSKHYSMLMADVVLNIVLAFAIFLFVIVLIVMARSIGTEIEIEYVTLGVLKSQGFTKEKLRQLFLWQYGLAEVVGVILGCVVALPLQNAVGRSCQKIIGTLPAANVVNGTSLILIFAIVVISFMLIYISTAKVVEISPVRAILGGREQIYFDHLFQLPIGKKVLLASLAFRQFTSAKKRYAGVVLIVAILTFFMVTVNLMGNLLVPENTGDSMGLIIPDIDVWYEKKGVIDNWDEVDELVKEYSELKDVNSVTTGYLSLEGENLYCEVYDLPETTPGMVEGREPLYENEIVITELVAEALELKIGDEVNVAQYDKESDYIISGIYQTLSDTGMAFSMGDKGVERLRGEENQREVDFYGRYYVIEDKSQLKAIEQKLKEQYGDSLEVEVYTEENNPILSQFGDVVAILKLIINLFSLVFAAVAVRMVCTKTFLQERSDIGIYKAIGFTSTKLRIQFAVRFFLVAIVGSLLGILLSVLASTKVLGVALRLTGLTNLVLTFTSESLILPVVIVSVSCMVFAFIASSQIKKVEVRELVVE